MAGQVTNSGAPAFAPVLRALVGDLDFTVISNNCWGAHIYNALDLPYRTPFIGLFIIPKSYLALLSDFDRLMAGEFTFVDRSASPTVNAWREEAGLAYPIGLLGGEVEINFQHYASETEVREKWRRRRDRMTRDPARRFFKFDDREGATAEDIAAFMNLPLRHKVCFSAAPRRGTVLAPAAPGADHVLDGLELGRVSRRCFNTLRWLSSRPGWLPLPSLL